MALSAAIAIGATTLAGTTAYQAYNANEQADKADKQRQAADVQNAKLLEEKKQQDANAQAQSDLAIARTRQRALSANNYGRGTLLTNPLGGSAVNQPVSKTLLGM